MSPIVGSLPVALRALAKRRGLFWARALTVAVVVTAVNAVFTVANAILLKPLPFPDPERLVRVYFQPPGTTSFADADSLDALAFVRFRAATRTMDAFVGIFAVDRGVTGDAEPESVLAGSVTEGFFRVLGGDTVLGRTFTEAEYATGAKVVALSHGYWVRRFGGDRSVVGRVLTVDREPHTIVGVVEPGFEPGFAPSELWTPMDLRKPNPYFSGVQTIGHLRADATPAQAAGELNALLPAVAQEVPEAYNGWKMGAIDLRDAQYGSRRPTILMLLAAVLGLAAIAVANLTNLTLADVVSRKGDFAVRAALGGSRFDLASSEIVQSLGVAFAGGATGLLAASWLVPAVLSLDPATLVAPRQLAADWRIVLCGFGIATVVMLAAVAAPVLRLAGPGMAEELATGQRRAIGGRSAGRLRLALVIAQTALGIVLLSCGALVVATFQRAARIAPGFGPENVVTAQLRLSEIALPTVEARVAFVEEVVRRLRETPGIAAASTTLNSFVAGQGGAQSLAFVEDRPSPDGAPYRIQSRRVTPGYFQALRIPVISGRDFQDGDRAGAQAVAIVSRSFASRYWPGQDPIGRRAKRGVTTKEWATVIAVVEDVRDVSIDEAPRDTLYTPFLQSGPSPLPVSLVVRTVGDPRAFVRTIQQVIWQVDPHQPLANVVTLEGFLHDSLGPQRFRALLVSGYAALGLLLATIGTYGVTARSVVERTREVAVRLAMGGSPARVWGTVAATSLKAVAGGALAGVVASGASGVALGALLPELREAGWATSVLAAGALVLAGCAATLVAARGVMSIEPSRALQG